MLYDVHNDKFNHEFVTSLAGVMEVLPRTKKGTPPESSLDPGTGVETGEPVKTLVPNTVKPSDTNKLCKTNPEFNADNLADDAVTDTEDKVVKVVENVPSIWRPTLLLLHRSLRMMWTSSHLLCPPTQTCLLMRML